MLLLQEEAIYETPVTGEVCIKNDEFCVEARLYEEPRAQSTSVAMRCDADYDSVFGVFVDPKQQQAASESVLRALQAAGIDLSGIASIEFEAGSIVVRIEADEATQRAIAALSASGDLSFSFKTTHRRGPARDTAWQPQDAAKFFSWYKPNMSRAAATDALRECEEGDFVVYTMPSTGKRAATEEDEPEVLLLPEDEPPPIPAKARQEVPPVSATERKEGNESKEGKEGRGRTKRKGDRRRRQKKR